MFEIKLKIKKKEEEKKEDKTYFWTSSFCRLLRRQNQRNNQISVRNFQENQERRLMTERFDTF